MSEKRRSAAQSRPVFREHAEQTMNPVCRNTCVTCWSKQKHVFLCLQKLGWAVDERRVLPGPSTATLATLWKSQCAQKLDLINVRRMRLWNEMGHPVRTVEMWWLRTTLAIFRGAVWAETCCCAPKVRCFQSRARSASPPSLSKKPVLRLFRCRLLQLQGAVVADEGSHLMGGLLYWSLTPTGRDLGEEQPWLPLHPGQPCE